jgi:hypothetical protein
MALPEGTAVIEVTGTYISPDGSFLGGQVLFSPSSPLTDEAGSVVMGDRPLTARLLPGTGSFSITLPCTGTAGLAPSGWLWKADVQVPGAEDIFWFGIPASLGDSRDISALTTFGAPPAGTAFVSSINGQTGAVELGDGFGILPPAGDIGGTSLDPTVTATHLAAPLPIVQGGTGAASAGAALTALGAAAAVSTSALATTATTGFLAIPSCAGVPTGIPSGYGSAVPMVMDSVTGQLYAYTSSAWKAVTLS